MDYMWVVEDWTIYVNAYVYVIIIHGSMNLKLNDLSLEVEVC